MVWAAGSGAAAVVDAACEARQPRFWHSVDAPFSV